MGSEWVSKAPKIRPREPMAWQENGKGAPSGWDRIRSSCRPVQSAGKKLISCRFCVSAMSAADNIPVMSIGYLHILNSREDRGRFVQGAPLSYPLKPFQLVMIVSSSKPIRGGVGAGRSSRLPRFPLGEVFPCGYRIELITIGAP